MAEGEAYRTAKEGGRHAGFLKNYDGLPDHLLEKAIRSMEAQIEEHRAWITSPRSKVGADLADDAVGNLVGKKWPKDIARMDEQIAILRGLLSERKKL